MNIKTILLSEDIQVNDYRDASGIVAVDDSADDASHEANLDKLIHLTRELPVPFFAKGNIQTLEDVKKFLYAGVKKVILLPEQEQLKMDTAARFGEDKLLESVEALTDPEPAFVWSDFKLGPDGLIPVVVQDDKTDQVLMVAYMNEEAYNQTLATGRMTYWSRSRNELWEKGATSGHYQYVKSLTLDCDQDTILAKVAQIGAACHTGNKSCFYQPIRKDEYEEANPYKVFEDVYQVILDRKKHPKEGSYTNYLFDKGVDKICKKIGEEATEIVIAAKNPNPEEIKYEISDFLYHVMVLMAEKQVTWKDITEELAKR
ncbi:bifunctional phosphoribosyl-AMP cyclohydrolase/phosphoribosyl-ATP diphosphatase HisIE [Hominifimenecus sp. rT4P-3]|uniref:bifunctional phosphoribosyl-AMP cyclohydrolase/phosphoribosyl-ATP diphosphatase HisIE n=1 Tax=Hominifimenecus sp. rT4P-3 TaxID=3242979 RepID=UPI003DA39FE3